MVDVSPKHPEIVVQLMPLPLSGGKTGDGKEIEEEGQ